MDEKREPERVLTIAGDLASLLETINRDILQTLGPGPMVKGLKHLFSMIRSS